MTLRVLRRLAVGGMAEIFVAREEGHAGFTREVALKRVRPEHARDAEYVAMFFDEARLLARLSHPHIVQVHGAGEEGGRPHVVMELVDGIVLRDVIRLVRERELVVSPRTIAAIGLGLAQALDYVHRLEDERGRPLEIVHRDLHPSNVIVSTTGVVKLLDFGIARWAARTIETATDVQKGTSAYMAPEQLLRARVDHRADVFALGLVLAELASGRAAVRDEAGAVVRSGIDRLPTDAQELARLLRAMQRVDPTDRPASMAEIATALAAMVPGGTFAELEQVVAAWTSLARQPLDLDSFR
jgi:serine/threonine protein kinase